MSAVNLFRAEWLKVAGNRWVVGGLVWFFPIMAVGILILMILLALFGTPEARAAMGFGSVTGGVRWTDTMVQAWDIPMNIFGRVLLVAFTAVVFAGEYQWGTWKNVLPRNRRVPLILTKFFTLGAFVVMAYAIMSLLLGFGMAIPIAIVGGEYGPAITGDVLSQFVRDYALKAGTVFTSTVISAGYAALAAMFMRSVLGGIMVGVGAIILEAASLAAFALLALVLGTRDVLALYQLTPTYNLDNVTTWINTGQGWDMGQILNNADPNSLGLSIFILAVWVVGLVGVSVYLFRKQDIAT